ncbi:MAG: PAS domain S-box-containing protein [Arcticibacterium sp.]|jgi:PAS domain S-box-containing protein
MKDSKPTYEELEKQINEFKSEKKLKQSEERLEDFFNLSPSLMVITNPNGEVFKINKSCKTILGYTEKEILEVGLWSLVHPDDIEKTNRIIEEQLKGNLIFNFVNRYKTKEGSYRTLEWQATLVKDGFTYANANDVTDRNEAVAELRKAKEKAERNEKDLKKAQEITHIGSWYFDLTTNELTWTEELFKMYGFDPDLPVPPNSELENLFTPESWETLNVKVANARDTGIPYELQLETVRKNRSNGWMWVSGETVFDKDNKTIGFRGASQDVTERIEEITELRKAKEKAEESERLKSSFLTNMSHEIRTPMNGVLGFAQLLKRKNISAEKREKYLDLIDHEGKRLLNIISDIVDISKIESNSLSIDICSSDVNLLIDDLHAKYAITTSPNVVLRAKKGLEDKDSTIQTDPNRLVQILSNLIENAIKFTQEGFVEFGYSLSSNELKFYVKDSGLGIDTEDQLAIFGRFIQGKQFDTHQSGSGLGLSIAKGLTGLLGGDVWVESKIGEGSTFFVTIPYINETPEAENLEPNKCSSLVTDREFTVLIAEDEFINFMYLEECLSDFNCTILHAYNGKEAVNLFQQNPSIDFILMDINMPEMNGYEALEEIRKTNKVVPIIAQTGLAMSGDKEKIIKAGFDDYLSKPVSGDLLITILNKHLKKKQALNQ